MGLRHLILGVYRLSPYSFLHKHKASSASILRWEWFGRSEQAQLHTSLQFCRQDRIPKSDMAVTAVLRKGEGKLPIIDLCRDETNGLHVAFKDVISSSASCLLEGGVIAVPTDTIYGVACLAQNIEAVNRIYEIKHRNYHNPVAISVGTIEDVYRWSKVTVPKQVLMDLLPGPVTVVFERNATLNPALNPHTSRIGIRIPNHQFMQDLAKSCNSPIALTSANISGASSCLQVEEFETLWHSLDLIVNGGKLSDTEESRLGSTVVDLSSPGTFHIIRPGSAYKTTWNCLHDKHGLKEISSVSSESER